MNQNFYEVLRHLLHGEAPPAPPSLAPLDIQKLLNYDSIKGQLFLVAVKKELDEEQLKDIPNRDYLDLSIICKLHIPYDDNSIFSIPVSKAFLNTWEITEKKLFSQALINSLNATWWFKMSRGDSEMPIFCISNEFMLEGAVAILLPQVFEGLIEEFQIQETQLYIFAVSVHKLFVIPKTPDIDLKQLQNIADGIPAALSNSIYLYDHITQKAVIIN